MDVFEAPPELAKQLESTAKALVTDGKGILAADETPSTLTKRFEALNIPSTPESRRDYRELLFTAPGAEDSIAGVILVDETIRQNTSTGHPLREVLKERGILVGIKVDLGAKRLAGSPDETVTEGLDGLRSRLKEYRQMGALFAKWRAVIHIGDGLPTEACLRANAHALARYAALCQEQGICPIVEPEVLMDGSHTIERCEEVTGRILQETFQALVEQHVLLEGMLLKPNMVVPGKQCPQQPQVTDVAATTLRCLRRHVVPAVPGIVFLSGGQDHLMATRHLNAMTQASGPKPWKLSFSYGRALQDEALHIWLGKRENVQLAQQAYSQRARCVRAAALGKYSPDMEEKLAA